MGGRGSSRWHGYQRRTTVEECDKVEAKFRDSTTAATVPETSSCRAEIGGRIAWLLYWDDDGRKIRLPVAIDTTRQHLGGRRWWFTCPLSRDGHDCKRRVRTLYRPPGAHYFGCRQCHDLTYARCQDGTLLARKAKKIASEYAEHGITLADVREHINSMGEFERAALLGQPPPVEALGVRFQNSGGKILGAAIKKRAQQNPCGTKGE